MWESHSDFQGLWKAACAFHQSVISTDMGLFGGCLSFCFSGLLDPIAWNVELQNHTMVNKAVARGCSDHRVFEDSLPFRERQIAGDEHTATLVPFGQEREQNFHFFAALLQVAQI